MSVYTEDHLRLLKSFFEHHVKFIVIGGHAAIYCCLIILQEKIIANVSCNLFQNLISFTAISLCCFIIVV